jgi:hypothetical protein
LTYVAATAFMLGPLNDGFNPDTNGYVLYSPYRQPLYGMWANALHSMLQSWSAVKAVQIWMFVACSAWVIVELSQVSRRGVLSAISLAAVLLVLTKLGLLNLVGSIISEGLFLPMTALMVGLFLRWVRTGSNATLGILTFSVFLMTQIRTAALLVITVPTIAAAIMLARWWKSRVDVAGSVVLGVVALGLSLVPPLLGKSVFQVSTAGDSTGFVLLPRVSLLPPSHALARRSPGWTEMSSTWRREASRLGPAALTQFDAQLQESVRYDIGPRILLPALTDRTQAEAQRDWQSGRSYTDAKRIAVAWILEQWPTYFRLSAAHLWGMLTMANYIGNAERAQVWQALNSVSPQTWREAPLRRDHPLVRIDETLKWSTSALYAFFRYGAMATILLGAVAAAKVIWRLKHDFPANRGELAVAFAAAWVVAYSIPAALVYAPEARYTVPNLLVLFSGAATWFAYVGTDEPVLHARMESAQSYE